LILMVLLLGCESSSTRDRLDLLSDQLERQERSWGRWREQVVHELRQQDSLIAVLTDSLASARVQLALARADGLACTARQRGGRAR